MLKLEPCPACSSVDILVPLEPHSFQGKCKDCGVRGPRGATHSIALSKWDAFARQSSAAMEAKVNAEVDRIGNLLASLPTTATTWPEFVSDLREAGVVVETRARKGSTDEA